MSYADICLKDLDSCPFCGSKTLYTKDWVEGPAITKMDFNLDSENADNSDMYESIKHIQGNRLYCEGCHKFIGTLSDSRLSIGASKQLDKKRTKGSVKSD